jgi:CRISPR/Cas system-associated endonuclease Cas3-HD
VFYEALKTNDINLIIAALFHDLGKAATTKIGPKGFPISYGHEFVSAKYVKKYEQWIKDMGADPELIYYIVLNHMRLHVFPQMRKPKQQAMMSHPDFKKLKEFGVLDHEGRG